MNWEQRTASWVDRGLIASDQRDALLADLLADPPERSRWPFVDLVIATTVGAASAMLLGAVLAVTSLFEYLLKDVGIYVVLAAAVAQIGVGGLVRWLVSRPVAEGMWAASLPVAMIFGTVALSMPWDAPYGWLAFLLLVPSAIATALAVMDRMPLLAFSAGFTALIPLLTQLDATSGSPFAEVLICVSALGIALAAAAMRHKPDHFTILGVQAPALTLLGLAALFARQPLFAQLAPSVEDWEIMFAVTAFGAWILLAGAASRSGWFLASALFTLLVAELLALALIGDLAIAALVLGVESLLVMVGVIAFLVVRRAGQRAPSDREAPESSPGAEEAAEPEDAEPEESAAASQG